MRIEKNVSGTTHVHDEITNVYFVLNGCRCVNVSNKANRTFTSFCPKTTLTCTFFFSSILSLF